MASNTTQVWTIGSLLTWTADFFVRKGIEEPRLSSELLLAHCLKCSRMALYTQYEKIPPEDQLTAFRELVKQRAAHVPVAYLIGKAWFFSLEFMVTRDVLIPRPDTETLVEKVISHVRQKPSWTNNAGTPAILDLCTGSGCIAIVLAKHLPTATIVATDLSEKALEVARKNAAEHQVADRITFLQGDLYAALARETVPALFHVIASNPPYIPTADIANIAAQVRDHEPRGALDGGLDGLDFHRRIVEGAPGLLQAEGILIQEMQFDQGPGLSAAFSVSGRLTGVRTIRDAAGHPRCVVASRVG